MTILPTTTHLQVVYGPKQRFERKLSTVLCMITGYPQHIALTLFL